MTVRENLGKNRQRCIQHPNLKPEPMFACRAGVAIDGNTVGEIGQHHTLAKLLDYLSLGKNPNYFLIEAIAPVVEVRRAGAQIRFVDEHRFQMAYPVLAYHD